MLDVDPTKFPYNFFTKLQDCNRKKIFQLAEKRGSESSKTITTMHNQPQRPSKGITENKPDKIWAMPTRRSKYKKHFLLLVACLSVNLSTASSPPSLPSKVTDLASTDKHPPKNNLHHLFKTSAILRNDSTNQIEAFLQDHQKFSLQPHQQPRMEWLRISYKKCLDLLKNPKFISMIQYGILAYLLFEIIQVAKEVYQEIQEDQDFPSGTSNPNALLSANAAKKLILWLEQPLEERGSPPNISPSWMVNLAKDLHSHSSLSADELYRILLNLTKPQATLLQSCLLTPSKKVSFDTIGGLSAIKASIQDWVTANYKSDIRILSERTPYDNFVSQGRQGIVLWGPPGCGKSMLIQAIANKSGRPTLIVTPSLLQRKWYGESTNQVRALFGLLSLLGKCTVVLDELDGLFRVRNENEHEANRELKTEWLQWWDGAASANLPGNNRAFVIAATNRPWDIDPAVWRRLPQRFYVGVPTWDDRCDLVDKIVHAYGLPTIHPTVVEHFADSTEGYTPSDLFQILQYACRKGPMSRKTLQLNIEDIQHALNEIPPTRFSAQYIHQLQSFLGNSNSGFPQQASEVSYNPHNPWCWQTPMGNFYEINVPVDSEIFDIMEDYLWNNIEWESSDEEAQYEEESEDEGDS